MTYKVCPVIKSIAARSKMSINFLDFTLSLIEGVTKND